MDRFLKELGEPLPSAVRMRRATQRVLENLSSFDTVVGEAGEAETAALLTSQPKRRWAPVAAVAAALLAAAGLVGTLSLPTSAEPIARRLNGKFVSAGDTNSISEGKLIQTDGSSSEVLGLRDGSRVEMSEGVKLSVNRATDGIQVDLNEGNIIVTAAKQHHGHLYVKTRDCVVSVVGTIFSVKAEAIGSRVAVIEGEVHVQHGDVLQTLLPGQQVATNTEMKAVPIQSEIGWSQDATTHVAMLQQQTATPTAPPVPVPAGNTAANPDLLGEIRMILAPVGQGAPSAPAPAGPAPATPANPDPAGQSRLFFPPVGQGDGGALVGRLTAPYFYELRGQNFPALTEAARAGALRFFENAPPNSFSFSISGIQGRTISFSNSRGETFSYGCTDCSFVVSENGISKTVASAEPGIEFKLSPDGSTLTATCHAAPCYMGRWIKRYSWTVNGAASNQWSKGVTYGVGKSNGAAPQTFTIPASQLTSQQNPSVLFIVTKP